MKLEFSQKIFEEFSSIKFHENPTNGSRVILTRRTDGRTDMKKLLVAFQNFVNEPKKQDILISMHVVDIVTTVLWTFNFVAYTHNTTRRCHQLFKSCFYSFLSVAASLDDTNHIDPKDKSGNDDKAKHFGYNKHNGM